MSEKKRVGMFKRKDAGRFRRKPRAITSIPTRSLSKSGEGWENKVYKFKRSFRSATTVRTTGSMARAASPRVTTRSISLSCWTNCRTTRTSQPCSTPTDHRCGVPFCPAFQRGSSPSWPAKHASGSAGDRCGQGRQHFAHRPHCSDAICIHGRVTA